MEPFSRQSQALDLCNLRVYSKGCGSFQIIIIGASLLITKSVVENGVVQPSSFLSRPWESFSSTRASVAALIYRFLDQKLAALSLYVL